MIEVYFGTDTIKVRQKAFARVEGLRVDGRRAENFDATTFQVGAIADAAAAVSLFGDNEVYIVDTPSSNKEMYGEVINNLESLKNSANLFIVIEGALLAADKKIFSKYTDTIEEYKAVAKERFNNFSLADALAKKDKKSLWVLFHQALMEGASIEEIIGILWWQLKTLRLVASGKRYEELGLKEFTYKKAQRALVNFKENELENLSHSLITLSHNSRLGELDSDQALERWILKI